MIASAGSEPPEETVHGTCIVLQEAGVLIRGAAGSGKSALALALLDRAAQGGLHASVVGDDRVRLVRHAGRLVARPHPALPGLIEVRGLGIFRTRTQLDAAVVRLIVDLVEASPRLPDPSGAEADLLGVALPRLQIDRGLRAAGLGPVLVFDALAASSLGVAARTHSPTLAWADRPDV
ncbi:MAG TPA: hypothetical protein VF641_11945 [Methylobacterium sp.]|jgi:serine kinase of HPr protein (carbohydrate metabolism regulator)